MVPTAAACLRDLLSRDGLHTMPCCFDALSARLIEQAGFPLTFMSGFAVSAARLALPDTGLITLTEMLDLGRGICQAVSIPVIGDGDTGHGNAVNVRRTVEQFARAGFAGVMIEDQRSPKRCGHTGVREVVDRAEALARIRAAVDARDQGADWGTGRGSKPWGAGRLRDPAGSGWVPGVRTAACDLRDPRGGIPLTAGEVRACLTRAT